MDLVSVFSTVVLLTTVASLAMALLAYVAYKVRERRKPKASARAKIELDGAFEPIFLKRHLLDDQDPGK